MERKNYSVIIPHRDNEVLLNRALQSIPQREDIEVIVVDNSFKSLTRERLVHQSALLLRSSLDGGAGEARNVGLSRAEGKFVVFLDCDDYFTSKAWQYMDAYLNEEFDLVVFKSTSEDLLTCGLADRHLFYNKLVDNMSLCSAENVSKWLYRFSSPCMKLIKTEFLRVNRILFQETPVSNDVMFSTKLAYHANKVIIDANVIYMITSRSGSLTSTTSLERDLTRYKVLVNVYEWLTERGNTRDRPLLISFVLRSTRYGPKAFCKYLRILIGIRYSLWLDIGRRIKLR